MASSKAVVFDLDGTLLDGDSASMWIRAGIGRSWWRVVAALVLLPAAAVAFPASRQLGSSIIFWVASVGLGQAELEASFESFAQGPPTMRPNWRPNGLAVLRGHVRSGKLVVIATAAPAALTAALLRPLDINVAIVGSTLKPFLGGWVGDRHCRHRAKCVALLEAGYGQEWAAAYSDSADDWPMLAAADQAFLINAPHRTAQRLAKFGVSVASLEW